jgi:hypothetical protein
MRAVRAGVMMILHCMLRRPRGGCGCVFEIREFVYEEEEVEKCNVTRGDCHHQPFSC